MRTNFGWARSAERYARLYRQLVRTHTGIALDE
jgi:hypothetical protein